MECRAGCGACCIVPPIDEPYEGHPHGKPAGQRCSHLTVDNLCAIYATRPAACSGFQPELGKCGTTREEAFVALTVTLRVHQALAGS